MRSKGQHLTYERRDVAYLFRLKVPQVWIGGPYKQPFRNKTIRRAAGPQFQTNNPRRTERGFMDSQNLYVETTQTDHFTDWSTACPSAVVLRPQHNPSGGHSRLREDSSGAVVPGAQVTLTNMDEGTVRTTTTNTRATTSFWT